MDTRLCFGHILSAAALMALAALFALAACTGGSPEPTPPPPEVADPLMHAARTEGSVRVLVQLAVPQGAASTYNTGLVVRAQRSLLRQISPGVDIVNRFQRRVPQLAIRVTPPALRRLRASDLVVSITLLEPGAQ